MTNFPLPRGPRMRCAALLLASPLAALAAELTLRVTDGPAAEATLYAALYDSAETFAGGGKPVATQIAPLREGSAQLRFPNLAPGHYALRVFADENGNGQLDTNPMGLPLERYGFSNDARGNRGAPAFEAAALQIDTADRSAVIRLR
ncbi:uncharacterized protein (DUF2141 family) [Variovorax sp. TBS-050B]|uniref:DUF2141 domain-containing protein n=1 Tax=Variovorax sp. TBS-050B TaxID=2940551 RepID=UPI00247687DC|nr:DUF2141 domain-containing protein [Variovorax sp. TBS-050B]MDH6590909.1 uncharacterized protein (DUF2141 family) [Variovorax sp. TBS-050B]